MTRLDKPRKEVHALIDDPTAFVHALDGNLLIHDLIPDLAADIAAHPATEALFLERLSDQWICHLRLWQARTVHRRTPTVRTFVALANRVAKKRWPDFPTLSSDVPTTSIGYCWQTREVDTYVDGTGWRILLEGRDVGPAEVISEEEWRAVAHNGNEKIVIARDNSSDWIEITWSEFHPETTTDSADSPADAVPPSDAV